MTSMIRVAGVPALVLSMAVTATTQILAGSPRVRLNEAYGEAIRGASLVPLVLPPLEPEMLESVRDV